MVRRVSLPLPGYAHCLGCCSPSSLGVLPLLPSNSQSTRMLKLGPSAASLSGQTGSCWRAGLVAPVRMQWDLDHRSTLAAGQVLINGWQRNEWENCIKQACDSTRHPASTCFPIQQAVGLTVQKADLACLLSSPQPPSAPTH